MSAHSLRQIHLFRDASDQEVEAAERLVRWDDYGKNKRIVGYRGVSTDMYFLAAGRARASIISKSGKEICFSDFAEGDYFGELAAIDGKPRSASVIALEDSVIGVMSAADFRDLIRDHGALSLRMLERLAAQVRELSERIFQHANLSATERVHLQVFRLASECACGDNEARIDPGPTQTEIASWVGANREAVSREFACLSREGIIERDGRALVIPDLDRLETLVEQIVRRH